MPLTSTARLLPLLILSGGLLSACSGEHGKQAKGKNNPGKDFVGDTTVRVTSPSHGAAVAGEFTVTVQAGTGLDTVELWADGAAYTATSLGASGRDATTSVDFVVSLPEGHHELEVFGLDRQGNEQSTHALAVDVVADGPWVAVTSPRDGATVNNPVRFTVNASADADSIEIYADDWLLGTTTPDRVLAYTFTGTGFARDIRAVAYRDGDAVATHELTITVQEPGEVDESDFNELVMDHLADYPTDGSYAYWWPDDVDWGGNPNDIYYQGDLFAEGDSLNRSFCVGMTFEVFMRSIEVADAMTDGDGSVNDIDFDELYDFRTDWYVRDLYGAGVVDAVENYGIGYEVVAWDDVRPGDFIQFWRHSGSGHNAIFIDWERDASEGIVGFQYWSTQSSTNGVAYNEEYFGSSGSRVDPGFFYVARVAMPWDWVPWR